MKNIASIIEETAEDNLTPSRLSSVRDTITTSQESEESESEESESEITTDEEKDDEANITEGVDKVLLSALSAASGSNVAEIRRIQILLLQEENRILHRELARTKSQLKNKHNKIERLEQQLKTANSRVVDLVRSRSEDPDPYQTQICNMMQIVNEKLQSENHTHQNSVQEEYHHQDTRLEPSSQKVSGQHAQKQPHLASTPRCKRKSLDQDNGQLLVINESRPNTDQNIIDASHLTFSQRTSVSATEDLSPKMVDRLESALRKTPRLASTDEVDFLVSSDTYQGAGACISEYLSDADYSGCLSESNTSLTMMSRGSARFGSSASRKTITPDLAARRTVSPTVQPDTPNHMLKPRTRLPKDKSPLISPSETTRKVTTPSTAMSSSAVRSSDTETCHIRSKTVGVLDSEDGSGTSKVKMVPTLRLASVGESGWMSGKHTAGDTYDVELPGVKGVVSGGGGD